MSLRVVHGSCDHDGRASGRLVIDSGAIRREIICECGEVLAVLGYLLDELGVPVPAQQARQAG